MTSNAVSDDALFTDALAGGDGTGAVPPPAWRPQVFPDALAAPEEDLAQPIALPHVPVPEIPAVEIPVPEPDRGSGVELPPGSHGTSAERAAAARKAAAARRDAAVASRGSGAGSATLGQGPSVRASGRPAAQYPAAQHPVQYPAAAHRPAAVAPAPASGSGAPTPAHRPPPRPPARSVTARKKKTGGAWGAVLFVIFLLTVSGAGQQILDALADAFNQ